MEQDFKDWIGRNITRWDIVTERLLAEYRVTMSPFLFEHAIATSARPGFISAWRRRCR